MFLTNKKPVKKEKDQACAMMHEYCNDNECYCDYKELILLSTN